MAWLRGRRDVVSILQAADPGSYQLAVDAVDAAAAVAAEAAGFMHASDSAVAVRGTLAASGYSGAPSGLALRDARLAAFVSAKLLESCTIRASISAAEAEAGRLAAIVSALMRCDPELVAQAEAVVAAMARMAEVGSA